MEVNGLTVLMLVFAISLILVGYYTYTGHKNPILLARVYSKNISKKQLKEIGKWTMISSIFPLIIALISLFIEV